jgi:diketogulonate reductase-like aldo/keto reductase
VNDKMEHVRNAGKAAHIGVSNYNEMHLKDLLENCKVRPSVNQVSFSFAVISQPGPETLPFEAPTLTNDDHVLH